MNDNELIQTIRDVAAERPDYVYEAPEHQEIVGELCFYVHTDPETGDPTECGCIIGHALNRLGIPLSLLARCEGKVAQIVLSFLFPELGTRALSFALRVQNNQDIGRTWSQSVEDANEAMESEVRAEHDRN